MTIRLTIIHFLSIAMISSCSFPKKALLRRANVLMSDLSFIKPFILREFPNSATNIPTNRIRNEPLKRYLSDKGITDVSIQYKLLYSRKEEISPLYSSDSLITFHLNKSVNDRYIFHDVVYAFGTQKPGTGSMVWYETEMYKVNDSVWITKTDSEIVFTY